MLLPLACLYRSLFGESICRNTSLEGSVLGRVWYKQRRVISKNPSLILLPVLALTSLNEHPSSDASCFTSESVSSSVNMQTIPSSVDTVRFAARSVLFPSKNNETVSGAYFLICAIHVFKLSNACLSVIS